jgi:molybdate transport system substrate-binding protein
VLVPGGLTALRLVNGEADLAVQQMSELVVVPGAVLVGPLPAAIQNYTVYSAVTSARTADRAAVGQFMAVLQGAPVRAGLAARGIEAP